jgi:hypothetical protein
MLTSSPTAPESRYRIIKATTRKEMDDIMDVIWTANHLPYEPFVQIFFPVLGYHPADLEAAIAESKERFWGYHQSDQSSNWYYVRDTETGSTVGCAQWEVHLKNPFAEGPPKLQAPFWPEGEYREFCELILNQVYAPRTQAMNKPHVGMLFYIILLSSFTINTTFYCASSRNWKLIMSMSFAYTGSPSGCQVIFQSTSKRLKWTLSCYHGWPSHGFASLATAVDR